MYNKSSLIVTLWEKQNFNGKRRVLVFGEDNGQPLGFGNLAAFSFSDKASSIQVQKGSKYYDKIAQNTEPRVVLYADVDYGGPTLELAAGDYAHIQEKWSSIKMKYVNVVPPGPPTDVILVPLVLELFNWEGYDGKRLILTDNCTDIALTYGFNDLATSVRVWKGPNYKAGDKVRLFRDKDFGGPQLTLDPDDPANDKVPNLKYKKKELNNNVSSVEFLL